MAKFGQRIGVESAAQALARDEISDRLRSRLWNALDFVVWSSNGFRYDSHGNHGLIHGFAQVLWDQHFGEPSDKVPEYWQRILEVIRNRFFTADWYKVYELIEWVVKTMTLVDGRNSKENRGKNLAESVNRVLESELAAYRIVDGEFVQVTDEQEVAALAEALADGKFAGVQAHLREAARKLSNREAPDYRNSIKESISAVESVAQQITGDPNASLGQALKLLEKKHDLHPALKESFSKLYGYASDADGIRHAMLDVPNLSADDAKFFLLVCTSFVNYLKAKVSVMPSTTD